MLRLALEEAVGNEQGEVHVFVTSGFDACVHRLLHVFPQRVAVGLDDHAAPHRRLVREAGFFHQVRLPLREVVSVPHLFYEFGFVRHVAPPSLARRACSRRAPQKNPPQGVFHSEGGRSFPRYHLDSDAACGAHLVPTRPASGDAASRGNGGPPAGLAPMKGASSAARGSVRRGIRAGSHPPGSLSGNGSRLLVPVCAWFLCIILWQRTQPPPSRTVYCAA